jgi:hypothetical protein
MFIYNWFCNPVRFYRPLEKVILRKGLWRLRATQWYNFTLAQGQNYHAQTKVRFLLPNRVNPGTI